MNKEFKPIDRNEFSKICRKHNVGLSYYFALKQEVSMDDVKNIIKCHKKKEMYEKRLINQIENENLKKVDYYLKKIVEWDLKVQEYWGFQKDYSKLTWINILYRDHPYLSKEINKLRFIQGLKDNT